MYPMRFQTLRYDIYYYRILHNALNSYDMLYERVTWEIVTLKKLMSTEANPRLPLVFEGPYNILNVN